MSRAQEIREKIRQKKLATKREKWKRFYHKHPDSVRKRQKEYYDERRNMVRLLLGDACVVCGSKQKIKYHEISGKTHRVTWSYILEHLEDFVPLCWDCHGFLHRKFKKVDWEKLKELAEKLKGSVQQFVHQKDQKTMK